MTKEQKETQAGIAKSDNDQDAHAPVSNGTPAKTEPPTTQEETAKAAETPDSEESLESARQESSPEPFEQEDYMASSEQEEIQALEKALESEKADRKLPETLDSEGDEPSEYLGLVKDGGKLTALRECLKSAFMNPGEVHEFCQDYLNELMYQLPENVGIADLVRPIIAYCESRGHLDLLYEFLAKKRPGKYISCRNKYQLFDSINRLELSKRKTGSDEPPHEEEQGPTEHPLAQGEEEIRTWFFKDLDQDEQSFVIAVALFEGADRQWVHIFSKQIKDLLFKEAAAEFARQTVGDNRSESTDGSTTEASTSEEKPSADEQLDKTTKSTLKDEFGLLQQTNVKIVMDTQVTEHGRTQVQTLTFAEPDQRGKVLRLLNQSLNNWLPELYEYLYELGGSSKADERHCAALAVAELMCKVSFVDLKNKVLLPWTKQRIYYVDGLISHTLSLVVLDAHRQQEVLNLIGHWISVNNNYLNIIALLTYLRIGLSHPDETLTAINKILDKKQLLVLQFPRVILGIVRSIYALYPELVIEYLHEWILDSNPNQEKSLRYIASLLFLDTVHLSDIPLDDVRNTRGNVVDLIFTLWASVNMLNRSKVQRGTTNLVKRWAEEAVEAQLYEPDLFTAYRRLFADLDERYARGETENRLEFYFGKWGVYDKILAAS